MFIESFERLETNGVFARIQSKGNIHVLSLKHICSVDMTADKMGSYLNIRLLNGIYTLHWTHAPKEASAERTAMVIAFLNAVYRSGEE